MHIRIDRSIKRSILLFVAVLMLLTGCGSIPDGEYTASVTLTGGSGKAYINSPCTVTVQNGKAYADIIWSSSNYDYMVVDGQTYTPVSTEGGSEFVIPVRPGKTMKIQADTTAMSKPHLVDYEICISLEGDGADTAEEDMQIADGNKTSVADMSAPVIEGLNYLSTDDNAYADCYAIHRYDRGVIMISTDDGNDYLILPDSESVPQGIPDNITVIKTPLEKIYLAASTAMCRFDSLDAIDKIALSGLKKEDWYIDGAVKAMDAGTMIYGGKYNAPDYEMMVKKNVDLAIESTMILHSPTVKEKIEALGIPVFTDRSSYEDEPLGRMEWIKVYGVLTGREDEAVSVFEEQRALVEDLKMPDTAERTVAVFSINSNHQIVTRRKNDYYSSMIEMAGGKYLSPSSDDEGTMSQITISVEAFYDQALNADILIYNGTIEDAPHTLSELIADESTFKDYKAVKNGDVWYSDGSLYQYTDRTGDIVKDLNGLISGDVKDTGFFHKMGDK